MQTTLRRCSTLTATLDLPVHRPISRRPREATAMRPRKALIAPVAATVVGMMLTGAPPAAHADQPAFVVNPISHVDTLIGTGTGG